MKSFTTTVLLSLSLVGLSTQKCQKPSNSVCSANNCARAVTGTRQGSVFTSQAKKDCSNFVVSTKYGTTVTVTAATISTVLNKVVPTYASACSSSAAYVSACSCYGITSGTIIKTRETATVTVTFALVSTPVPVSSKAPASSAVPASSKVPTSSAVPVSSKVPASSAVPVSSTPPASSTPPITGPPYNPTIPSSYDKCDFNPATGDGFELLDPNALAIINKNGKASESTDPDEVVPAFTFSHPPSAPANVYDAVIPSGAKPLYLAIFKSGVVGFVETSSNGQTYIPSPNGDFYVTTVWSVQCNGLATAGLINGAEFLFAVQDKGDIALATAPAPATRQLRKVKARDIPVPQGFYVKPKKVVTPPGSKCPSPEMTAVTRDPPRAITSNGCGPQDWRQYFIPNLEFESACNYHDVCWSTCSETMDNCNSGFIFRMYAICMASHAPRSRILAACNNLAEFYLSKVSGPSGSDVYTQSVADFCQCECKDKNLKACGDKCVNTKTDPENCGSCNFHCPSGACTNGACSFNSCSGETCYTFGSCGPGGDCVCASITGGTGFCVDGNTPCDGLLGCADSAGCPLGSVCAVGTCCERNVCIRTDACGGYLNPTSLFMGRDWINATVGHPGVYEI